MQRYALVRETKVEGVISLAAGQTKETVAGATSAVPVELKEPTVVGTGFNYDGVKFTRPRNSAEIIAELERRVAALEAKIGVTL